MKHKAAWMMMVMFGVASADDVVLFDAATTPMAAVASQSGGKFELRDGLLEVETKGETGFPGVRIKGVWDLSSCNRLTLELVLRDRKGELPLTVRLDNPDSNPGKSEGVFIDRVKIRGKQPAGYTVALPPPLPYAREINSKLFGMRRGPFATTGVAADLDASRVVGVAVYIKEPKLDWLWGVKRIVAHTGP
ncbi:MAG: hypothetical protein FJ388_19200, partial [Verrucomicrobia bacterium]|nr:hypothetical protein [Verrucomicrobiota bacterium]